MSAIEAYAKLRRLGGPFVTTGEAAATLGTSQSAASRTLRTLERRGLMRRVRHGLWNITPEPMDPLRIASELTRPYPAYISLDSALAAHGAIDQIPREIEVASLAKPRRIRTTAASFVVHRVPPELFGGFEERDGVRMATPEKALFDAVYIACASGHPDRRLPELDLPRSFSRKRLDAWISRVRSARLRTLVRAGVARALAHADVEDVPSRRRGSVRRSRRAVRA